MSATPAAKGKRGREMDSYRLTAEDAAAFRMAESVSFHTYDGRSFVRLYLDSFAGANRVWTVREQNIFPHLGEVLPHCRHREIEVSPQHVRLEDYSGRDGDYSAYAGGRCSVDPGVWRTIARTIRKGDTLGFRWIAGNDSDVMRDAGLSRDELRFGAEGPDRKNTRWWVVETVITRADSGARMVNRPALRRVG